MPKQLRAYEVKPGYEPLMEVLYDALRQASNGKGDERHAGGKVFIDQPIFTIAREHGLAFLTGQAAKKLGESHTLLSIFGENRAIAELYGAIVYTAAAIILLKEQESKDMSVLDEPHQPAVTPARHCTESLC